MATEKVVGENGVGEKKVGEKIVGEKVVGENEVGKNPKWAKKSGGNRGTPTNIAQILLLETLLTTNFVILNLQNYKFTCINM